MSTRLLYVADPMCSWCYGFGPQLRTLLAGRRDVELDLLMGGLRPFNREPMSDAFRAMLREHWDHVADASGLPLEPAALQIEGFHYDTEPACRAVVTARRLDPSKAFEYYGAVQAAFYRDAKDVTRAATLADIAAEHGFDAGVFATELESEDARADTRRDFEETQRLGVGGFPTLAVGYGDDLFLVASGFVTADVLEQRLAEIDRRVKAA
ncbi:MAG TPA: DsbA family protein [Usitatibacter sp.]|nr:DsbA family protein [Usitatibacter sp.]